MASPSGFLISQIKHISDRLGQKLLDAYGLADFNGAQGKLLYVLWQEDGISSAELARRSGLAPTTLTSMLDRMEQQGLVTRVPHETDRRRLKLTLTQKAKDLKARTEAYSEAMNEVYFHGFTREEIEDFEAVLARVLANLQDCEKNVLPPVSIPSENET